MQKFATVYMIITIGYKLDQLSLCSLLFLCLLSRSSLHLTGGIQLATHELRLCKDMQRKAEKHYY